METRSMTGEHLLVVDGGEREMATRFSQDASHATRQVDGV